MLVILWTVFPIFVAISTSLKPSKEVFQSPATFIPRQLRLSNYIDIWFGANPEEIEYRTTYRPITVPLKNSLIVTIGAVIVNLIISVPAAYALARFVFPGRKVILISLLVSQMFSPPVFIIYLFRIIAWLGLIDTYLGLILVNVAFTLAFSIWILEGFFEEVPRELEEAAWIDGASRITTLTKVILPLIMPGIFVCMAYTFVMVWGEYLFALTFVSSESMKLLSVHLVSLGKVLLPEWQLIMAASVVACAPPTILFIAFGSLIKKGIVAGAIKG